MKIIKMKRRVSEAFDQQKIHAFFKNHLSKLLGQTFPSIKHVFSGQPEIKKYGRVDGCELLLDMKVPPEFELLFKKLWVTVGIEALRNNEGLAGSVSFKYEHPDRGSNGTNIGRWSLESDGKFGAAPDQGSVVWGKSVEPGSPDFLSAEDLK